MAPLLLKCNNLILFAERGVLTWVRVVGGLRGGRLDAREPPLRFGSGLWDFVRPDQSGQIW